MIVYVVYCLAGVLIEGKIKGTPKQKKPPQVSIVMLCVARVCEYVYLLIAQCMNATLVVAIRSVV